MSVTISVPIKNATGTLNRRGRSFIPGGSGGMAVMNIAVNWQPNQPSGPVSFSFTFNQSNGSFPAGTYPFTGHIATPQNPCDPGAIACGTVKWPGAENDEVPWQATGGPEDEVEDTEKPSPDTEKPYNK